MLFESVGRPAVGAFDTIIVRLVVAVVVGQLPAHHGLLDERLHGLTVATAQPAHLQDRPLSRQLTWVQGRAGQVRSRQFTASQDRKGQGRAGQDRAGQDRAAQIRAGQPDKFLIQKRSERPSPCFYLELRKCPEYHS